jgi:hypothetical protein
MISSKKTIVSLIIFLLFFVAFTVNVFADSALEITQDSRVNINSVLHLKPLSNPPATPQSGDIYFTTTDELLIYANGKWNGIFAATASHATAQLTSGSGTWTVPAGIYSIQVSLTGGGGSGANAKHCQLGYEGVPTCSPGGNGGHGGVLLNRYIDVTPGQTFSYSVDGPGGATTFSNLSASGGGNGNGAGCNNFVSYPGSNGANGSPYEGSYPYAGRGSGGKGGVCNGTDVGYPLPTSGQSGAIAIQY